MCGVLIGNLSKTAGIFNYFSGWLLNVDTGNYDRLLPVRRDFDFGDDLVTFVEPQGTSK